MSLGDIEFNGAAAKEIRRGRGASIASVAAEAGIIPSYLGNLEAGRKRVMSAEAFLALCRALRISDRRALMAVPSYAKEEPGVPVP